MDYCHSSSVCFELIKGMPAAFVTLVIGGIAAYIAWRQYQATRAKLKLDLFEKRYDLFEQTWGYFSEVLLNGPEVKGLFHKYSNQLPKISFLFGKDVEAYVEEANSRRIELWKLKTPHPPQQERPANDVERILALETWFEQEAKTGVRRVFAPYLNFETWH